MKAPWRKRVVGLRKRRGQGLLWPNMDVRAEANRALVEWMKLKIDKAFVAAGGTLPNG